MSVASEVGIWETAPTRQHPCYYVCHSQRLSGGLPGPSNWCIHHRSGGAGGPKKNFPIACMEGNRLHRVFWSITTCRTLSIRPDNYQGEKLSGRADDLGSNHATAALHWLEEGGAGMRACRS